MKAYNLVILVIMILSVIEVAINEGYYFGGSIALLCAFWFGKQLVDLTRHTNKK